MPPDNEMKINLDNFSRKNDYNAGGPSDINREACNYYNQGWRRKGAAPHPLTDPQQRSLMTSQSASVVRVEGFESSSKSTSKTLGSGHTRDHQSWTEKEQKEFYSALVKSGSLQFKQLAHTFKREEEKPGTRFKNKWNGERKRAITRGPMTDYRTFLISIINDYILLLSDKDEKHILPQSEREALASQITDLISCFPLATNSNASVQDSPYITVVRDMFFPYKDRLSMLKSLFTDSLTEVAPFSREIQPSIPPPAVIEPVQPTYPSMPMPMQMQMPMPVQSLQLPPSQLHTGMMAAGLQQQQKQIWSNGQIQSLVIGPLLPEHAPVFIPVPVTTTVFVQHPCSPRVPVPDHVAQKLDSLPPDDLTWVLRNILETPQYKDIIELPLDLNKVEGKARFMEEVINRSNQLRLAANPVAVQNVQAQTQPVIYDLASAANVATVGAEATQILPGVPYAFNNPINIGMGIPRSITSFPAAAGQHLAKQITHAIFETDSLPSDSTSQSIKSGSSESLVLQGADSAASQPTSLEAKLKAVDALAKIPSPAIPSHDTSTVVPDPPSLESTASFTIKPLQPVPADSAGSL